MAERTYITGNLGPRKGKVIPENTMKFVWQALSQKVEGTLHFEEDAAIPMYETKLENEELPDGIIVLENLNFKREEFGFELPDTPPEPSVIEEEEEEEEPDFSAMSAKEKKAYEAEKKAKEEQKKKEEEEAAAAAAAAAAEGEGEEEEKEEEPEEEVIPPVTVKEVSEFKELMAKYADIHVNDALDASLGTSNTITGLRTDLSVMGVRMTQEIRKLGKFFLYEQEPLVGVFGGE